VIVRSGKYTNVITHIKTEHTTRATNKVKTEVQRIKNKEGVSRASRHVKSRRQPTNVGTSEVSRENKKKSKNRGVWVCLPELKKAREDVY